MHWNYCRNIKEFSDCCFSKAHIFGPESEGDIGPVTHVSVTVDGIPEVVEVHQIRDAITESQGTPALEQPKKKKGKKIRIWFK